MEKRKMKWQPKSYQDESLAFAHEHQRCALWKEMGLGKTSVAGTLVEQLMDTLDVDRTLVVGPKRVIQSTWPQELAKWDHLSALPYRVIEGSAKHRSRLLDQRYSGIESVTYENLRWLVGDHYKHRTFPWDLVIMDEASKLKAPGTRRFRALRRRQGDLPRVLQLTGSPAPSGLLGIWSQVFLLDGGARLGRTYTDYRNRWFHQDPENPWRWVCPGWAQREIHDAISDIVLPMRAKDYLDLPPLHVNPVWVDLPRSVRELYAELEKEMFLQLERGTVEAANGGVLTGKCRQLTNGFLYLNGDRTTWDWLHEAKLEALDDVVVENAGKPLLVAYQFKADLAKLRARYRNAEVYNEAKDPVELEARWNRGEVEMMLIHPGSAGHGLNLQEGTDTLAMYGIPWSYDQYEQTIARIAGGLRRGRPTFVHMLLASGSVDVDMLAAIEGHRTVQEVLKERVKARRAARRQELGLRVVA